MSVAEKPGVLERLGSALNSSDLSPREGVMGAVELIGAMAYTQTNPDTAEHERMELACVDPRTELGSVLVRLKYGGDRALGERGAMLLTHWVRHQRAFRKWKLYPGSDGLLERFARQALAEWLYPVCDLCSGRQALGMDKGEIVEKRIRCKGCLGKGSITATSRLHGLTSRAPVQVTKTCMRCGGKGFTTHRRVRQTKAKECHACNGTGRRRPNDSERAHALKLDHRVYRKHWLRRFDWLSAALDRLDKLEKHCLHNQLRDGITRA